MNPVRQFFSKSHGTERGYVRHCLALLEFYCGRVQQFSQIRWDKVDRVVFVCLGNICRSAYAHQFLLDQSSEVDVVSVGLSTTTGVAANPQAIKSAAERGVDLTSHRATDISQLDVRSGDLFLVMEIRQARRLQERLQQRQYQHFTNLQVGLLGTLCRPPRPHLHDPFSLSPDYFQTCFSYIEDAVNRLVRQLNASG